MLTVTSGKKKYKHDFRRTPSQRLLQLTNKQSEESVSVHDSGARTVARANVPSIFQKQLEKVWESSY